jgi:phosphatidylethanolamine/phosphatidyl-N-methylethanolamine N-methyltransferase
VSQPKAFPLEDEFRFLRGLIARPRNVGAIAPSSPALARAIAREINPELPGPILELGPGTGVVTEALVGRGIDPSRITAIEFDADFAKLVASRFPRVNVIRGDAFDLVRTLGKDGLGTFAGIVSGVPLLNHPPARRGDLIESALQFLQPGAPYVQFSYGMNPPIPAPKGVVVRRAAIIWKNLPPARVWVYRRSAIHA